MYLVIKMHFSHLTILSIVKSLTIKAVSPLTTEIINNGIIYPINTLLCTPLNTLKCPIIFLIKRILIKRNILIDFKVLCEISISFCIAIILKANQLLT